MNTEKKIPKWDKTESRSTINMGPWTVICQEHTIPHHLNEPDIYWEVIMEGPYSEWAMYGLCEEFECRERAEWAGLVLLSNIINVLETFQRYL